MNIQDYCVVFDNVIPKDTCDLIIRNFERASDYHERYDYDTKPNFTQLNVTRNKGVYGLDTLNDFVVDISKKVVKEYKKLVPDCIYWPEKYAFEEFRIKRYNNDGVDCFSDHIDAADISTAKRFLAFFWYLNDVEEGGETEFLNFDLSVKPKAGRLLMFPPLWLYPHRGNPPVSNSKYLLGSYLHFV